MIRSPLIFLTLLVPLFCEGAGKGGPSAAAMMQSQSRAGGGGGGGGGRGYEDPRRAPPMDPKRRINEQDCTKPIDFSAGNLRCKGRDTK